MCFGLAILFEEGHQSGVERNVETHNIQKRINLQRYNDIKDYAVISGQFLLYS